jgi:hypothetical protein
MRISLSDFFCVIFAIFTIFIQLQLGNMCIVQLRYRIQNPKFYTARFSASYGNDAGLFAWINVQQRYKRNILYRSTNRNWHKDNKYLIILRTS